MIVSLRGPNGSGKTTVARSLLHVGIRERRELYGVEVAVTEEGVAVVGRYSAAKCGGMDTVKSQAQGRGAVLAASRFYSKVLFEGVIVSTIYGPWLELSQTIAEERGEGIGWAFLDTPLVVCLARIQERNGGKPIKEDQVASKHRLMRRMMGKAATAGEMVYEIEHDRSIEQVRILLGLDPRVPEGFDPEHPTPIPPQGELL